VRTLLVTCAAVAACASPRSSLIRTVPEPPGSNCPSGGVAIQTGLDEDGDGKLEDSEITETSYVCDGDGATSGGTLEGSMTIASSLDPQLLAPFTKVTGTLTINADGLSEVKLPNLVEVGALATSGANVGVALIELDKLSVVDSDLAVAGAVDLTALHAPKLATVGGALALSALPKLATVDVPALRSAAILSLDQVTVDLTAWPAIDVGTLYLEQATVTTLAPIAQSDLASATLIQTDLTDLAGLAATTAPSQLLVQGNAALVNAQLLALTSVGSLTIDGNDALVTLNAPALTTAGAFYVFSNPLLPGCQVDTLLASLNPAPSVSSTTGNSTSCP
jgi:hypothetical protein